MKLLFFSRALGKKWGVRGVHYNRIDSRNTCFKILGSNAKQTAIGNV